MFCVFLIHILFDLNLLCSYISITCIYLWPSIAVLETENSKLAWSLNIFVWVISYLCQGVAYAIDRIMANCSIIPIMNASFDTSINVSVAANKQQFVIKMKSPQDLFYIDNNYTYAGQVTKGFWYISYFRWLYLHVIAINQSFTALAMKFKGSFAKCTCPIFCNRQCQVKYVISKNTISKNLACNSRE